MRATAEKRHNDWRKAARKRYIVRHIYCWDNDWFDNLHQYSKNKVHCSCGMCSRYSKTNNRGRKRHIHGNYAPSKNWSLADTKRIEEMKEQIQELDYE